MTLLADPPPPRAAGPLPGTEHPRATARATDPMTARATAVLSPAELAEVDRASAERASAYLAPDHGEGARAAARRCRADLVRELECVRRWQRLAQARLDLATQTLSPPELPGGSSGPAGDTVDGHDARRAGSSGLAEVVAPLRTRLRGPGYDAADELRAAVAARRALAARAGDVARRLAALDAVQRG